jgi:fructose-1,6-bisphosphatase/inositol monophosphatase family enzyme
MRADLRAHQGARRGRPTLSTKPYDISGALLCAQAAGCIVTAVDGGELDFPIDVETPISWVGWVNEETRARLAPHLAAALAAGA